MTDQPKVWIEALHGKEPSKWDAFWAEAWDCIVTWTGGAVFLLMVYLAGYYTVTEAPDMVQGMWHAFVYSDAIQALIGLFE